MGLSSEKNMYKLPLIVLIVLLQLINNVAGQTAGFIEEPTNTQVRAGEEGSLRCVLDAKDGTKCFWSRNEQEVTIGDTGRYTFTGDRTQGDCSISITGSNFGFDDGSWACGIPQTSDVTGLKSRSAIYTVLSPPTTLVIKVNGEEISNGSDIILSMEPDVQPVKVECWAESGNPAATLTWTLGGYTLSGNYTTFFSDLSETTETAVLELTAQIDETWPAQYLACVANHDGLDESYIAYGIVRVNQPVSEVMLTVFQDTTDIQVSPNTVLSVVCTADGYPFPIIKLQKRDSDSEDWQDYQQSDEPTDTFNYTFVGFSTQLNCIASNDGWITQVSSLKSIIIKTELYLEPHDTLDNSEYPTNYQTATSNAQVGTIIAIVVVCIVVLVIMGVGVFTCYKKKMCLFKVHDPVEDRKKSDAHDGKKDPAKLESGDQANQQPLLNEVNENQYNGNQKADTSPNGTRKDEDLHYANLNFNEHGNQSPLHEQRTEYATIKPRR